MTPLLKMKFLFLSVFWTYHDPAGTERLPCTLLNLSFETGPCCGWVEMVWTKGHGPRAGDDSIPGTTIWSGQTVPRDVCSLCLQHSGPVDAWPLPPV